MKNKEKKQSAKLLNIREYDRPKISMEVHMEVINRIRYSIKQRFGSISFWRGSGSGFWDPHLGKVDPDPRIHLSVIVDPDPRIHIWKVDPDPLPKWIRIRFRVPFFIFFIKKFMSDKLKCLFYYRQNLEKAFLR